MIPGGERPATGYEWPELTTQERDALAGVVRCEKCDRPKAHWPLQRGARCSPADWVKCIRQESAA